MAERAEPIRIGVRQLRGRLADYLHQAKSGARFLIVSRGQPIAELGAPPDAPAEAKPPRKSGVLRGKIWMADDWDEWPEGFLDAMENNPIEPEP
jgi:antitoxin (DNA-binding transcriptional repressor) of toxin-antitoxin stability system